MHMRGALESIQEIKSSGDIDKLPTNRVLVYDNNQEEYLDLVQVIAVLLLPTLVNAGKEWKNNHNDAWTGSIPNKRNLSTVPVPQTESLFSEVLSFMLESLGDPTPSDSFPTLNAQLVRDLLIAHGENDRAADSVLVEQMVEAGHSSTLLFDEEALVNALTCDLGDLDYHRQAELNVNDIATSISALRQKRSSTNVTRKRSSGSSYYRRSGTAQQANDVFFPSSFTLDVSIHSHTSDVTMEHDDHPMAIRATVDDERPPIYLDVPVSAIDSCVDGYSSVALAVATFAFFLSGALALASIFLQPGLIQGNSIVHVAMTWLLFSFLLVVGGYVVIGTISMRNLQRHQSRSSIIGSLFCTTCLTWIPPMFAKQYVWYPFFLSSGSLCSILLLMRLVSTFLRRNGGTDQLETKSSTAAARKVDSILKNAFELRNGCCSREETMINFHRRGARYEESGGLFCTWGDILSCCLFDNEGIWIGTRLYIIQFTQLASTVLVGFMGHWLIRNAVEGSRQWHARMENNVHDDWIAEIIPSPRQAKIALYPAFVMSMINMLRVFLAFVPSYVETVLQFRCGTLPSFKSPQFDRYRRSVHNVYRNIGNAAWGMVGSGIASFAVVSLLAFLFVWPPTRDYMRIIVAMILAYSIASLAFELFGNVGSGKCNGFFRSSPRISNLMKLGMECAYIVLGGGSLVCRASRLIFDSMLSTGRINGPSNDTIANDDPSSSIVADMLQQEAHCHPYMERLAAIYVQKLRDESFGTQAGACWRQLFVLALMPWLSKYRTEHERLCQESTKKTSYSATISQDDRSFVFKDARLKSSSPKVE